ncbi:MAG: hypothetical protein IJ389_00420 [Clostridia bacterium]|nr:hypothetical protein [Clostridia bacterium]
MRKLLALVFVIILIVNVIPVCSFATEKYPTKKIVFTYQSGKDYNGVCFYSDGYFSHSAYEFDQSLATMSISLSMAAFGSAEGGQTDYSDKSVNARNLLCDIGFDIATVAVNEDFTKKPTFDSMGVIAASKPLAVQGEEYTLIALALRGGGYEAEWASNLTVGAEGDHQGFEQSKDIALAFLRKYVSEQGISGKVKLWICGFSRSAGAANLLAGALDDGIMVSESIQYSAEDIYAYCFETPAAAISEKTADTEKYSNIFNILNRNGLISYLAPASYGLSRYGQVKYLPTPETHPESYTAMRDRMVEVYDSLPDMARYRVDDFKMKKLTIDSSSPITGIAAEVSDVSSDNYTQSLFLSESADYLSNGYICTREDYAKYHQEGLRELFGAVYGCTSQQYSAFINALEKHISLEFSEIGPSVLIGFESKMEVKITNCILSALNDAHIVGYSEVNIKQAGKTLTQMFSALMKSDTDLLASAAANLTGIKRAHYPELCYAWLASGDPNYYGSEAQLTYSHGEFKKIRLHGNVHIDVISESGERVIADNTAVSEYTYICGSDVSGKRYMILPSHRSYTLEITSGEDSIFSVGISEYSPSDGKYMRNINFFDLPSNSTVSVSIGSDGSYLAQSAKGDMIEPDAVLSAHTHHRVNVLSSDTSMGKASADGGRHLYGEYVTCTATAREDHIFCGWYDGDTLVSEDAELQLCVKKDIQLTALFYRDPKKCDHSTPSVINASAATCIAQGFSGDVYCPYCNTVIKNGEAIPKLPHTYEADKCSICGEYILPLPLLIAVHTINIFLVCASALTIIFTIIRKNTNNE